VEERWPKPMAKRLSQLAPAKVNLFLRITGRREDGYHEIDSVFIPVSLCDRLQIEFRPQRTASAALECVPDSIPSDERNLALRAAYAFMSEFGVTAEVRLRLHKQIPVGAGLGGGSSDAGTVLRMMAALSGIGESPALASLALRLGADVPFFLNPAPARVRGIGEHIMRLGPVALPELLIAIPPVEVSTALVFGNLQPHHWSGPAPASHLPAVIAGQIGPEHLVNDLEKVATLKWPVIAELKKIIALEGARGASMSGSGGAVFGIFDSRDAAIRAAEKVRCRAAKARVVTVSVFQHAPDEHKMEQSEK